MKNNTNKTKSKAKKDLKQGQKKQKNINKNDNKNTLSKALNHVKKSNKISQNKAVFNEISDAQKNKKILWGNIFGVQQINERIFVGINYKNARILIPESHFFEKTFKFNNDHIEELNNSAETLSGRKLITKKTKILESYVGSKVCFIPVTANEYKGAISSMASRTEAMEKLKIENFFTDEGKHYKNEIVSANVLQIKHDRIIVECLGVETRIDAYNCMPYFVENCKDVLHVGEKIKVRIKKLYIHNEDKSVYLSVSARLNETSKLEKLNVKSFYKGVVDSYNKEKNVYSIKIAGDSNSDVYGIACVTKKSGIKNGEHLIPGDTVLVYITEKNDNFAVCKAVKYVEKIEEKKNER